MANRDINNVPPNTTIIPIRSISSQYTRGNIKRFSMQYTRRNIQSGYVSASELDPEPLQ